MKKPASLITIISIFLTALNGFAEDAPDLATIKAEINQGKKLLRTSEHQKGLDQLNDAAKDLQHLLAENTNSAKTTFELGMVYFYMEDDAKALKYFDQAAFLAPDNGRAHFFKGLIHRYADDNDLAEASFLKACEVEPKDEDNWYELGVLYYNSGKDSEAITAFKKALSINPKHKQACYKLALNYMNADEATKAYPLLLNSAKTQPNSANVHYNLGQLCQNMGKTDEAQSAFRKVVELDPADWRAMAKLVQLNQTLNNRKERDAARQMIFDLRSTGNAKSLNEEPLYIRDQFTCEGQLVMALEYFEMKGDRAIRYSFVITDETGKNGKYRITLGSYDMTNAVAVEMGDIEKGQRIFHLDGYYENGSHRTFDFFKGEPSYDVVKKQVIKILKNEKCAISSTTPTPGKDATN